jgi:predicted SnoaL-like aldol condensation-catalyzing enzyme
MTGREGTVGAMDADAAARRWAETWQRAWPARDIGAIAALYTDGATYRALVHREPDLGVDGVRDYLRRNFDVEYDIEVRFGAPVAAGDRAAVEWWASWHEAGADLTMAGVTMLRFDDKGLVVDHRDYWNEVSGRHPPFAGW